MRRPGPRPLGAALAAVAREAAPATTLAAVQERWIAVAGPTVAAEATPSSERGGVVTIACRTAAWAHELDLLSPDLLIRLNGALAGAERGPSVQGLRFVTKGT